MKKIIMLLTVAAMLATSAMCVSAEEGTATTPTLPEYTVDAEGKYSNVTHSGLTANEYYGVVVVKGTTASTVNFSDLDNILYIDQVTADENGITIPAFMTKGDELLEGTIFIGGEGLPTATNIGYLKLAQSSEPEKFIISGTVSGYAGTILPTVTVTDGTTPVTATVNSDGTFSIEVPVLESGSYTLTATKTSHLSYTKANITAEATVNPVVKGGDMNADGIADVLDMGVIVNNYNAKYGDDKYSLSNDVNEDSILDVLDMGTVVKNYNSKPISE